MNRSWQRNVEGLRSHAQQKALETGLRAEAAITQLLKEQRPVNFTAVAATAGISTAWLYGNQALKQRIMQLREQQVPAVQVNTPSRNHASTASKDAVIAALQKRIRVQEQRIREQAADIERLKQQVEVAYGLVAVQANRKDERT